MNEFIVNDQFIVIYKGQSLYKKDKINFIKQEMSTKQAKAQQIVEKKLLNSIKHNLNHFQFIRKRNLESKQKSTIFSNNLLKTLNSLDKNINQTKKKIQNSYSPKKILKQTSVLYLKMKNMNPYKLAVQQNRKIQNLVFCSLQKSIQIKRQPIQIKTPSISMNISRQLSKSRKSLEKVYKQSMSQVDILVRGYINKVVQNPQPYTNKQSVKYNKQPIKYDRIKSADRRRISLVPYRSQSSLLTYIPQEKSIQKV